MKNWKRLMAGFCAAMMVGAVAIPVCAEEAAEEAASEEIADITETMKGLWMDDAGDIYGFYSDYSFFGQWVEAEEDVVGAYSLVTDGENVVLTMDFLNDEEPLQMFVYPNEEENILELSSDGETVETYLAPYTAEVAEGEVDANEIYQAMADNITEVYCGYSDAEEFIVWANNDDGSFCSVIVLNADWTEYVSFMGTATVDEETGILTVTDDYSGLALECTIAINEDGTIAVDMGDAGAATLEQTSIADAVFTMKYCQENATPIA